MKIDMTVHQGIQTCMLTGEIDMQSSPVLRKELIALVQKKTPSVMVDFTGVTFIDSSGIATFVEVLKGMMVYGGKLKLVCIPERILEIFGFARLDRVFEIHRTRDDAMAG